MRPKCATSSQLRFLRHAGGFSLVEMLGGIAVIALLATVAVSAFGPLVDRAKTEAAKRNAHMIADAAMTAQATGSDFLETASGIDEVIDEVSRGVTTTAFAGRVSVGITLRPEEREAAKRYLTFDNRTVSFNPNP